MTEKKQPRWMPLYRTRGNESLTKDLYGLGSNLFKDLNAWRHDAADFEYEGDHISEVLTSPVGPAKYRWFYVPADPPYEVLEYDERQVERHELAAIYAALHRKFWIEQRLLERAAEQYPLPDAWGTIKESYMTAGVREDNECRLDGEHTFDGDGNMVVIREPGYVPAEVRPWRYALPYETVEDDPDVNVKVLSANNWRNCLEGAIWDWEQRFGAAFDSAA